MRNNVRQGASVKMRVRTKMPRMPTREYAVECLLTQRSYGRIRGRGLVQDLFQGAMRIRVQAGVRMRIGTRVKMRTRMHCVGRMSDSVHAHDYWKWRFCT
jgi:hypothetical protein